jgi:hypothetical protein
MMPPFFDMMFPHATSPLCVGRRTARLNTELLCVFDVQPLPAFELQGVGADDAADGSSAEQAIQNIESNVPARGASASGCAR